MTDAVVHVVDDDESARESLAFLLESADLHVETYASAPAFRRPALYAAIREQDGGGEIWRPRHG